MTANDTIKNVPAYMSAKFSDQSVHAIAEYYDPEWSEDTCTPFSGDHLPR